MVIERIFDDEKKKEITRLILEALPEWFGIPESREEYIADSAGKVFFCAYEGDEPLGFAYMKQTGEATAELAVIAIRKEHHGKGIGRTLFESVRAHAADAGYTFLQVKTVQMGRYPEYDRTNMFYRAVGFREFEVFPTLWGEKNPCQIYVMIIGQ